MDIELARTFLEIVLTESFIPRSASMSVKRPSARASAFLSNGSDGRCCVAWPA